MPNITLGDFTDVFTPTNDPLFFLHHVNLDRLCMTWQFDAARTSPGLVDKAWGYPENYDDWRKASRNLPKELAPEYTWIGAQQGCGLHDIINSRFPFTQIQGIAPSSAGLTHHDVLQATNPGVSPYIYDSLLHGAVMV